MGNRALVILKDDNRYSPVMYLHWHACQVQNYINRLKEVMHGREGDLSYAFARLLGIVHNDIEGNLSLGCWSLPAGFSEHDEAFLKHMSHGDAGIFVVSLEDYSIGNYAASYKPDEPQRDGGESDREVERMRSTERNEVLVRMFAPKEAA